MATIPAPLSGKIALITGGSRGIGAGIVAKLAHDGCTHIATTYVSNKSKADAVLEAAKKHNPSLKTVAIKADLLDPNFGPSVISQTLSGLDVSKIDIVISNAALVEVDSHPMVADMTKEQFDKQMTANAWAPLSLAKAAIGNPSPSSVESPSAAET